jgi:hypothetical protein
MTKVVPLETEVAALLLLAATWLPERAELRRIIERIGLGELTPREGLVLLDRHGVPPAPSGLSGDGPASEAVARVERALAATLLKRCVDCLRPITPTATRCKRCELPHRHRGADGRLIQRNEPIAPKAVTGTLPCRLCGIHPAKTRRGPGPTPIYCEECRPFGYMGELPASDPHNQLRRRGGTR